MASSQPQPPHKPISNNNNNKPHHHHNNQQQQPYPTHINNNTKNSIGSNQQPMKKNLRAWSNPNNNNNNNNTAWRNSSPASNNSALPPHFINPQPTSPAAAPAAAPASSPSPYNPTHQQHFNPAAAANDEKLALKAMHDRMIWFIMSLVGLTVTATTKSGQRFQGLLSSAVTESELCITLKRAVELPIPSTSTLPSSNSASNRSPPILRSTLIILAKELVQVVAEDIDLNQLSSIGPSTSSKTGATFKTDSETLGYKLDSNGQPIIIREKELKTWVPSPNDLLQPTSSSSGPTQSSGGGGGALSEHELMNGLEDSLFPKGTDLNPSSNSRRTFDKPWDQFEANEKLFGTRTDFDEEIYTTKLDRSGKDFKERERKAEALAREIMASSSANPHVQEERGVPVADDSGMDEEDKYGAVIRSEGAYVPPGARKGASANRGTLQPPSSTAVNSKQQASSLQNPQTMKITASMPDSAAAGQPEAKPSPAITATKSSNPPKESLHAKISQVPSKPISSHVALNFPNNPSSGKHMPSKLGKQQPEEVAPRFKAFVSDEKERLQQKKKDLLKKEKESRLADLRAFSTSFKLPMAFPKDLEPIVKKSAAPSTTTQAVPTLAAKPDPLKQTPPSQDEAGRRASAANTALADKNYARHMSKPLNPSNLHIVTNISTQAGRMMTNTLAKPVAKPSIAIGLTKLGPLAPIPPFKPRNQANLASSSTNEKKSDSKLVTQQNKLASRFANLPPIPPFKPKGSSNDAASKDAKAALKAAAFNPAAKTFSPVPGTKNKGSASPSITTTTPGRKTGETGPTAPANPFFGHTPIRKGSSSIHVKEEFTPFKSGSVPEASSVGPAWSFAGKSYRQIFGASLPPPHHGHFMPHSMHHTMPHQQQQQQHHHHQQPPPQQQQHQQQPMLHHHAHPQQQQQQQQQHPQPHGNHGLGHPPHSQVGHMMTPPMHMQHSQPPHFSHHPPPPPPNVVPQMMTDDDGMSGPMSGGGHMIGGGGNSHVVNGPGGMMMGGGPPGSSGPGYMGHNNPAMNQQQQQQQQQQHPHHLPPPIPPYMYHPQHHPQQQSPISYNNGSYRQSHGSTGPPGSNLGYGPPVPVNMTTGPVPNNPGYPTGPPVVTGPGNPTGSPFVPQINSYPPPPGSIHPNSNNSNNPPGPLNNNQAGNQVHFNGSPQMGGMSGHGPPGGMYPPPQMYPPSGDNVGHGGAHNNGGHGGGHGSHGTNHGGHHGSNNNGGGGQHHHHNSHSSGGHGHHNNHGGGGGHHSNGPSPTSGPGGNNSHLGGGGGGGGRGRGNSGGHHNNHNNNNHNHNHSHQNQSNQNHANNLQPQVSNPTHSNGPPPTTINPSSSSTTTAAATSATATTTGPVNGTPPGPATGQGYNLAS
ncbi:hypothetical protein MJO29_006903 [Puccinia striiformis f. sp. tritici]|nr:hypothetical protein MJO29_006903 [Puccinia striiformis f. sp. tritici]